jgi:hypothetical protein
LETFFLTEEKRAYGKLFFHDHCCGALAEAGQRGAVQAVVVTAHLDEPKRQALRACGLEVASEWWVTPQGLPSR